MSIELIKKNANVSDFFHVFLTILPSFLVRRNGNEGGSWGARIETFPPEADAPRAQVSFCLHDNG